MARLFAVHTLISVVPVLLLGIVLARSYKIEARNRGLAAGQAQATLLAQTAVEPLLDGDPLEDGLTRDEDDALVRIAARARRDQTVLRLRVRDSDGHVVFPSVGLGHHGAPDGEAMEAAAGEIVSHLTRVNADRDDVGPAGVNAIEVYLPLVGRSGAVVGVLEVYLPYDQIAEDVSAGLQTLYRTLTVGLAALYLALLAISWTASREVRREARRNAFLAEHDTLTGLPNRTLFHRQAKAALRQAQRDSTSVALAIIDLDRFKEVNDTLGHHNGDHLLKAISLRLEAAMRPGDTVARLGGDEFGVIVRSSTDAMAVLRDLRGVIDREVDVTGLPLSVEASAGYVLAPDDGVDVDELLQRADVAMYVAKTQHEGVVRYDPSLDHYDASNLALVAELRRAIDAGELVLHYQPMAALADGRFDAVEALVRWQHPTLGLLGPDRFLPLAEQTDLIDRLTDWVLAHALVELRGLSTPAGEVVVAVNVSGRNLARADFARHVVATVNRLAIRPQRLILEITETALITDPARAAAALAELAAAGVRVSVDDFGKGQTSLGYLSTLPIHELKIDRGFVADMLVNPAHAAIVRSVVDLGHNLSLRVVGEGVETDEVLDSLRATGCDLAQGYLLARPMPLDALRHWLATAPSATGVAPVPVRSPRVTPNG